MRIALLQFDCGEGQRTTNLERVTQAAFQAAGEGVDLLVLPELWCCGYDLAAATEEEWGSAELQFLQHLS